MKPLNELLVLNDESGRRFAVDPRLFNSVTMRFNQYDDVFKSEGNMTAWAVRMEMFPYNDGNKKQVTDSDGKTLNPPTVHMAFFRTEEGATTFFNAVLRFRTMCMMEVLPLTPPTKPA